MNKFLHIIGSIFLLYFTTYAQGTITFTTATDNGATVKSETISGDLFATISTTDGLAGVDLYDYGPPLGNTVIVLRDYESNGANNAIVTFSKPVNLTSIYLYDGYSHNAAYTITPSPLGSNSIKNGFFAAYAGEVVTLNFTNIQSFSIDVSGIAAIGIDDIVINAVLPVELTSFTGTAYGSIVALDWATATEVNNYGFNVERASTPLGMTWESIAFVQGHGNSNSPKSYSFEDKNPPVRKVQYRLKQIDFNGAFEYSPMVEVNVEAPSQLKLAQNYPNPFNPETTINYQIPFASRVTLKVYNVLGREVATLVNEFQQAGTYNSQFSILNSQLSSGVYFYKLQTDNGYSETKKLMIIK